jgi:hypothetical protein
MVCEAVSGYTCNTKIYTAKGKKLEAIIVSLLDRNLSQDHHIHQDKQPTPRGPKQEYPDRLSWDFSKHKLHKIVAGGQGKKMYPARKATAQLTHSLIRGHSSKLSLFVRDTESRQKVTTSIDGAK